jgi:ABC-type multidrug transport system ATPase subunit
MSYEPLPINAHMNITLLNIGRRFNREWIFRRIDYTFESIGNYAILGSNGSGKSTLLQVLNGSLVPSEGAIQYFDGNKEVEAGDVFKYLSLAAPYLEVIEEFSLNEMIDFHFKFKQFKNGMDKNAVADILNLEGSRNKLIKYFSSGMKQRLKLALAFCADTPMLMLDEPTSNLDTQGIDWYLGLVEKFSENRLTIVCSNQEHEYSFCNNRLSIADYK